MWWFRRSWDRHGRSLRDSLGAKAAGDKTLGAALARLIASLPALDGVGVPIAGLLLGMYGQHHLTADSPVVHQVFLYTYLSMAVIIALPAIIFARVPDDTSKNVVIRRRKRSEP